jgi:hypothetical protein
MVHCGSSKVKMSLSVPFSKHIACSETAKQPAHRGNLLIGKRACWYSWTPPQAMQDIDFCVSKLLAVSICPAFLLAACWRQSKATATTTGGCVLTKERGKRHPIG